MGDSPSTDTHVCNSQPRSKMFGDLKSAAGVKALNEYLAENSYIEGYVPSQADTAVFEALKGAPGSDCPHALRWYNHIKSFGAGMKQFAKSRRRANILPARPPPLLPPTTMMTSICSAPPKRRTTLRRKESRRSPWLPMPPRKPKPALIAKTSVLIDVKPWDDETDMGEMLKLVKSVEMDGLVWGSNKLVPIGYGINKLQVMCTVEDEKVSIEELTEKIETFEDFVQSVDIAAMNKI